MSVNSKRRVGFVFALVSAAALVAPAMAGATIGSLASSDSGSLGSLGTGSFGSLGGGSLGSSEEGFTCSALSTDKDPAGWGIPFDDEKKQLAFYSDVDVLDADGSLKLKIVEATPDNRSVSYHSAGSIPLADAVAKEIGFDEKAPTSQAAFQLRLSNATNPNDGGYTTLYWVAAGNDVVDTTAGETHTNIQDGLWISTRDIGGVPRNVPTGLDDIIAANPAATVEHYGMSIGRAAQGDTNVDAVKFNGCTTNFAVVASTGSLGSLGNLFGSLGS
ncbi:hypothetical protein [Rhodococcus sp. IEGM 1379]|uniref:hypothetical protein n=1 Tax=Rhodococcus sp. IEGM 1379 TaxID=3047086 RepID=UPI0024B6B3B1|nr:hypothetical protein [Rhodococcus sp. IEGM 1379]MDI9917694.1 hypothetical protein [Rhodococcus sp. IEGM 1379]